MRKLIGDLNSSGYTFNNFPREGHRGGGIGYSLVAVQINLHNTLLVLGYPNTVVTQSAISDASILISDQEIWHEYKLTNQ